MTVIVMSLTTNNTNTSGVYPTHEYTALLGSYRRRGYIRRYVEAPIKFASDTIILSANLASSNLPEICLFHPCKTTVEARRWIINYSLLTIDHEHCFQHTSLDKVHLYFYVDKNVTSII